MSYSNSSSRVSFVNWRFQVKFVVKFVRAVLIGVALTCIIFYLLTYKELGGKYSEALFTLYGLSQNIIPAMFVTGAIVIIVVGFSVLALALVNSNKIAGPIYRVERNLELMGKGDLTIKTAFRTHDAINRLAEGMNDATESLNNRLCTVVNDMRKIREETERLRTEPEHPVDDLLELIETAKENLSGLRTG